MRTVKTIQPVTLSDMIADCLTRMTVILYKNCECSVMCAVTEILALTFTDNAFEHKDATLKTIYYIQPAEGQSTVLIPFKDLIMNTSIFYISEKVIEGVQAHLYKALSATAFSI